MEEYNGQEVAWLDLRVRVLNATLKGCRGLKYELETEKEALYAAGNLTQGIQTGNQKVSGTLKVLKNTFDMLNDAAVNAGYDNITAVPPQLIIITANYKVAFNRPMRTDIISGIGFSKFEKGFEQNAKFMEIEMPFIAMSLQQS
jgi:hypothetical protein